MLAYWIWYRVDTSKFEETNRIPVEVTKVDFYESGSVRVWMTPLNGMNDICHDDPLLEPMNPLEAIAWAATGRVEGS